MTCSRLGKTILAVTYQTAVPRPSLSRLPTHLLDSQLELLTMSDSNTISRTDTTTLIIVKLMEHGRVYFIILNVMNIQQKESQEDLMSPSKA